MSRGDESGMAGGMDAVVFGVVVLVLGVLVVANAWAVVDAKMAVAAAAREAVRTYVESTDPVAGLAAAEQAAADALAGHGRAPGRMQLDPGTPELRRCARVTMRVTYPVPLVAVPVWGRLGGQVRVSASHSEVVDPYRSGLPAEGGCEAAG